MKTEITQSEEEPPSLGLNLLSVEQLELNLPLEFLPGKYIHIDEINKSCKILGFIKRKTKKHQFSLVALNKEDEIILIPKNVKIYGIIIENKFLIEE